jgi:hypothetical protein
MRHPNILNVHDFGDYNGTPYMIVEYVPGGSLAQRLSQGRLGHDGALRYLRGIAAGLDYAHSHGIVHRDIKPANVLLEQDDTPVLADFGLAKLMQGSSLKSMSGVTTGTPAYMAPEQVVGREVGPAADRYSLATIAYEMLTGVIPFDGEALLELLYAQVHREPPVPSSRNPSLNARVDAVVMRGLAKNPEFRWESCMAFVNALEVALESVPVAQPAAVGAMAMAPAVASTAPLVRRAAPKGDRALPRTKALREATVAVAYPAPGRAAGATAVVSTAEKPDSRRRISIVVAAAALVLLLIGAGVCAALGQKPSPVLTPSLSLSPSNVVTGGSFVASATNVPAGQVGEIHLQSQLHIFPFRAGSDGTVSREIALTGDVEIGNHLVSICWGGTCRAQATLTVFAPGTLPTPASSPTPGASPTPGSTPRSTPRATPRSTPTGYTGGGPHPSPTPAATNPPAPSPKPTPRPSPRPSPTPPPTPNVTVGTISTLGGFTVTLHYFASGTWSIYLVQGGTTNSAGTMTVPTGYPPTQSQHFPPSGALILNNDYVKACQGSVCYSSNTVAVSL